MSQPKQTSVSPPPGVTVVIGVFSPDVAPPVQVPRSRIEVALISASGAILRPAQPNSSGASGQVFAHFENVHFENYTIRALRRMGAGQPPIDARVNAPLIVNRSAVNPASRQVEANVTLEPVATLMLSLEDALTHTPISTRTCAITLAPEAPLLDSAEGIYEVIPGTTYTITVVPHRGMNYGTQTAVVPQTGATEMLIPVPRRRNVLYITIDRPTELTASPDGHDPNIAGLEAAARQFDNHLQILRINLDAVPPDADALEQQWHPFSLFCAGSFTEWYHYGNSADSDLNVRAEDIIWTQRLNNYIAIIRKTDIPIFAVCGSHQLMAAAFNGFGALAHMNNNGPPISIAAEHAITPHRLLAPKPRVGEEGTYPLSLTAAGSADPVLSRAALPSVWGSDHHKDMVTGTNGFTVMIVPDNSRSPCTGLPAQAIPRCLVQGMRRNDSSRLLYSTQFHPEINCFLDATTVTDGGFGARLLVEYFREAEQWWNTR